MALAAFEVWAEVVSVAEEVVVRDETVERFTNQVDVDGRRRDAEPKNKYQARWRFEIINLRTGNTFSGLLICMYIALQPCTLFIKFSFVSTCKRANFSDYTHTLYVYLYTTDSQSFMKEL